MVGLGELYIGTTTYSRSVSSRDAREGHAGEEEQSWALLWSGLLSTWGGRREGTPEIAWVTVRGCILGWSGSETFMGSPNGSLPSKHEAQFSRNSFLEGRDLAWFLRSLRILIEA